MRFSSWRFNSLATRSLDREACLFGARRTECAGGTAGRSVSGGAAAPRVSAGGAEGGGAPCWTCARPDAAAANNAAITRTAKTCFMGHTHEWGARACISIAAARDAFCSPTLTHSTLLSMETLSYQGDGFALVAPLLFRTGPPRINGHQ